MNEDQEFTQEEIDARREIAEEEFSDAPADDETPPEPNDDDSRGQEPAESESDEQGDDTPSEATAKDEPPADPLANLPPEFRTVIDAINADTKAKLDALGINDIANRLKQAENRIGAVTNQIHSSEVAIQEAIKKGVTPAEAPTKKEVETAMKDPEKWAEFKEEWPEVAGVLEGELSGIKEGLAGINETKEQIGKIQDQLKSAATPEAIRSDLKGELSTLKEELKLELKYPDYEKTINGKDFVEWEKTQSEEVRKLMDSPLARDAIACLDKFEEFKKAKPTKTATEIQKERNQRLGKSSTPEGKQGKPIPSEDNMDEAQLRTSIGREVFAND